MSLASFHYAFDSRDELIDELITTVVARETGGGAARRTSRGTTSANMLEAGTAAATSTTSAPTREHEQAMLELTQYALRSPERHPLAVAQYAAVHRARRARSLAAAAEHAGVVWTHSGRAGRARAHRLHRRAHPHVARRPRRRRRTGGRTRGRRRPFENGRRPDDEPRSRAPPRARTSPAALARAGPPRLRGLDRLVRHGLARHLDGAAHARAAAAARADRRASSSPRTGSTASSRSASSRASPRSPRSSPTRSPARSPTARPRGSAVAGRGSSIGAARLRPLARDARLPDRDLGDRGGVDRGIRRLLHHDRRAHRDDLRPGAGEPARLRLGLDVGAAGGRHHRRAHPRDRARHRRLARLHPARGGARSCSPCRSSPATTSRSPPPSARG